MPLVSVVLPTYNEAGHIQELLREVAKALEGVDHETVVVDDNSPDGTFAKVEALAREDPRIVPVLRTRERGLATAVIEGMRRSRGTYVAVMDSDFQHPPSALPRLLAAAMSEEADVVVGSRYVEGGSFGDFTRTRHVISWGAKTLAVLALPRVRRFRITDPMSGFFLFRRAAVDPESLKPRGYKILIEVLVRGRIEHATEVGFAFGDRRGGKSKLRLRTQWDYFWHVVGLGLLDRENRRVLTFLVVGLTGIVVNLAVYEALLHWRPVDRASILLLIPAAVAREISILWNFVWNDSLTFRDVRGSARGFLHRALRFNLVSLFSFAAYLGLFAILIFAGVWDVLSLLIAIAVTFVLNYGGNRHWTYARRRQEAL